jgi:signal transduction histidine kinase
MELITVERARAQVQSWHDPLELIASELRSPLDLLRLSAEGLAHELRATQGDPTDISAAETLLHSAERMNRIVQELIAASRDGDL